MNDPRADNVKRFREEQGAVRVYMLTAIQPFTVSQDRFIVVERRHEEAWLIHCTGCTPRTALGNGNSQSVSPETLQEFITRINAASAAWDSDAMPPGVHDGITLTVEIADAESYRRVRMVDPADGSPHDKLLSAWMTTFPEVAIALT
ncbi:MAG: hypothetical protein JXA10_05300 [Anaerolineae bacterium]|nr:hypothetical protein [Anaerolineae bacterium]